MKFEYNNHTFDIRGTSDSDHIFRAICSNSTFYEIDLLEYIRRLLFDDDGLGIAIDVGANIGNHSIFFRKFLVGHVISIEPNSKVLPTLRANLTRNISGFSIYENGLGESASQGKVVYPEDSTNNIGMAKLSVGIGDVDIITLDEMLHDWRSKHHSHDKIKLIKIDVEGMEVSVLRGAIKTIEAFRPHLFIEAATPDAYSKLNDFLGPFDYYPVCQYAETPVYHFTCRTSRRPS